MLWIFLAKICAGALSPLSTPLYHYCICQVAPGALKSHQVTLGRCIPRTPLWLRKRTISPQLSSNQWCAHCCRHHIQLSSDDIHQMNGNIWAVAILVHDPSKYLSVQQEWYCKLSIAEALGKRWLYFLEMLYDFTPCLLYGMLSGIWKDTNSTLKFL